MLIGRGPGLARLEALIDAAVRGFGGALVLRGEPGIGKSALLAHARERAQAATVLSAHGLEAEADLPFAGLSELLAPVLGHLAAIPAPQRAAGGRANPLEQPNTVTVGALLARLRPATARIA